MKGKYSKVLVGLVIALNIGFTIAVLAVFRKTGAEPTALVAAWFSFTTGELWLMASIKKMKVRKGGTKPNEPDQLETETDQPEILGARGRAGDRDPDRRRD